jgi:hypothetical protein
MAARGVPAQHAQPSSRKGGLKGMRYLLAAIPILLISGPAIVATGCSANRRVQAQVAAVTENDIVPLTAVSARKTPREVLGIPLGLSVRRLLASIERTYGKAVSFSNADLGPYWAGDSFVAGDGAPTVRMNPAAKAMTEASIAHELMHLGLKASGFPEIKQVRVSHLASCGALRLTADEVDEVRGLLSLVRDTIEHWYFNPELRKLHIATSVTLRESVEIDLAATSKGDAYPDEQSRFMMASLNFMRATLELDTGERDRMAAWYRNRGWGEYQANGARLAALVTGDGPGLTPEREMAVAIRCANVLLAGFPARVTSPALVVELSIDRWGDDVKGTFKGRCVDLAITVHR